MKQLLKVCVVLLCSWLILTSADLYGQINESGAPASSTEIKQSSHSHIYVEAEREPGQIPSLSIKDSEPTITEQNFHKDTESIVRSIERFIPAHEHLEQFDRADRENATISIELFNNQPQEIIVLSDNIKNLWETGDYSNAINKLKELDAKIGPKNYGIAVAWKVPKIVESPAWGGDVNVSMNDSYWEALFDFHYASRNLLAVARRAGGNDPRFTVHISTNQGASWAQTWYWWGGEMIDVGGAVVGNHFYVSYVYDGEPQSGRVRRFSALTGADDATYGWQTAVAKGVNIKEIITVCNQDYFNNMAYIVALLEDNQIIWVIDDVDGTYYTWSEINTYITNAAYGLSGCYSRTASGYWFFLSFITTANQISIMRSQGYSLTQTKTFSSDARDYTSISGYNDNIICAYEQFSTSANRPGIRYFVTSDGGDIFLYNDIAAPTSSQGYYSPGVSARRNCGYAIAYHSEMGAFDPLYYRKRDYNVINWTVQTQINQVDVFSGSPTSVEYVPENYGHGVLWISGDASATNHLYFDKNPDCVTPCVINVTSPNGGESIGCSANITWTSSNASGNVKIEYYCGDIWNTIINSTPNDGQFTWTVPSNTVCSAKIKISDVVNSGCWDMSDNYFNINCTPPCNITVTSPNGGETLTCGTTPITWTSANASANVKIEYLCDALWFTIVNSTPNDGSYTWSIPSSTVCSAKIKITDVANSACSDMSDDYFDISCAGCSFTITSPNGGENITCGTTITWTSSGASGNVKLEYYCGTWNTIIASTPNDGSYAWTIPAGTACNSKIKVSDVSNSGCWDMSDNYFNINCPSATCQITVTSPNGGETIGCNYPVHWTSTNASAEVKIEYQCNSSWNVIVNSTTNDGTFDWHMDAGTNCSTAKIRITDVVNAGCQDQSDNNFTINCGGGPCTPPYVKPGDVEGAAGMDIQVPIHLKGNTTPVDAFGLEFSFCSDKLHLLEVIKGPLTAAFSFFQFQETTPGNVTIGGFHTTAVPVNSDGILVIVRLHVDACTSGETCILTIAGLVDDLASMNACSGTFTCGIPCNLGDVNNDGSLTPGDALCTFQIYLNGGTPPSGTACDNECALIASDVNCTPDGITPGDALYIFQGYLGGMTLPLACKPAALPKESGEINVTITSAEGKPGDEVVFTIELDRPESIQAFGIDLGYPAELLTFAGIRPSGMTTGWEVLDGRVNIDGVVTIGGFNPVVPETHNSVGLVDVVFRIHDDADGFGELWLFNFTDDLAQASSRSGRFGTSMEGVRRLGGLEVPSNYHLEQNYPNPFNMDTEIMYQLPEAGYVSVTVYNSVGHQIRSLVSEHHEAGRYAARWDGTDDQGNDIPSGVYIYQIKTGKFSDSKKMILIK